jgi:putative heme-binding domain-containing protein
MVGLILGATVFHINLSLEKALGQSPQSAIASTAQAIPNKRAYQDFAMGHEGNVTRGQKLFADEQRAGCTRCHTVDGSSGKAGTDLFAAGDKLSRLAIVQSVLEPSREIAVGYATTVVQTKEGEEYQGILKQATDEGIQLMGADGKILHISASEIAAQHGSSVSLMPEGLQAGMTVQEFTDLVEYVTELKQPETAFSTARGMPRDIPALAKPVEVRPFLAKELFHHEPGGGQDFPRLGLVWFAQVPGQKKDFLAIHQSGLIWLIKKKAQGEDVTVFANFSNECFSARGPNGLLGMAFHPSFRKNRKYYLKHQVFEEGKIATVVEEREAALGFPRDSGHPARRLLKIVSTTQDHSGGCLQFGPDGLLYIGMGDTGPQTDPQGHGQDLKTLLGKMLRIDVDAVDATRPYAIPATNPFAKSAEGLPEIWALGFREPWRFSFDPLTGDLWVGDVGQDRIEEVDIVRRGENHGWNVYEGFEPFSKRYRKENAAYIPPVFAYKRKYGNSVTGGFVYRGDKHSSFYGVYICGDYTSHQLFGLTQKNRELQNVRQIGTTPQGISSFGTDERGNIYVVGYEGMIYHWILARRCLICSQSRVKS